MPTHRFHRHILILADIEGSSVCYSYRALYLPTRPWAKTCAFMSRDVDAVVRVLLVAGVELATVIDLALAGCGRHCSHDGVFAILFFVNMHVYMTITGHALTTHVKAMFNGWEDVAEEEVREWEKHGDRQPAG